MILSNNAEEQTPQFRVLSDWQCREIFQATLECLSTIGVLVDNAEGLDLLAQAGAQIEGHVARIPAHVITQALGSVPKSFTVWGRAGEKPMRVELDRVHFGPGLTNTDFIDPQTGVKRLSHRGDPAMTARVVDALDNIDYVMGLALIGDVTPELASVYEFAEMIANSEKPIAAWAHSVDNIADIYRIATAVAGGDAAFRERPSFTLFSTYPSPLKHTDNDIANIFWAAEHGVPVVYLGGPTLGLEAPFTSASGLVIHQATALSALAMVQLKCPGAPMAIGGVPSPMDLRSARPAYGSPEMSLNSAAAVDLARFTGVPFMGTAGASESKLLDSQAAIESTVQVLMSALSGASMVHDIGFLDGANIGSLELLVMNDEIIGLVKRILRGVRVSKETIMLDVIKAVGPGGQFLTEPRSASLGRKEVWMPNLLDRNPYPMWEKKGSASMEDRVRAKLSKILDTHHPAALPEPVQEQIAEIIAEAESRQAGQ